MKKHNFLFQTFLLAAVLLPATVFAQTAPAATSAQQNPTQQAVAPKATNCSFATVGKPEFNGKFLAVKKKGIVQPGDVFTIQVFVQNTGNLPWFSEDSGCNSMTVVHLGTEKERDRISPFYTVIQNPETGSNTWVSGTRVKMDGKRVSPLDTASFTITAKAPEQPGVYREYFAPVAEGVTWMEGDALFSVDINVGNASLDPATADYLKYVQKSTNLSTLKLEGGKNILVDLSQQRMYIKIGDTVIRTFPVSTGAPHHPTPPGKFKIIFKQTVRVAGSYPHYIMPLFMEFKAGGYGIHALPSLGNDRGVFWREALNHIGSPRSHGCIRLLPQDAQFVWDFGEVGTPVAVQW